MLATKPNEAALVPSDFTHAALRYKLSDRDLLKSNGVLSFTVC